MTTATSLTLHLAQAIGLYMIVAGLSGLAAPQRWQAMLDDLARSAGLQMVMGFTVFAIGAALAIAHSILVDPLAIIVTVIGWLALLEGALLIATPGPLIRIGQASLRFTRHWAFASIALGLFLALAGLTGRADAAQSVFV